MQFLTVVQLDDEYFYLHRYDEKAEIPPGRGIEVFTISDEGDHSTNSLLKLEESGREEARRRGIKHVNHLDR